MSMCVTGCMFEASDLCERVRVTACVGVSGCVRACVCWGQGRKLAVRWELGAD